MQITGSTGSKLLVFFAGRGFCRGNLRQSFKSERSILYAAKVAAKNWRSCTYLHVPSYKNQPKFDNQFHHALRGPNLKYPAGGQKNK